MNSVEGEPALSKVSLARAVAEAKPVRESARKGGAPAEGASEPSATVDRTTSPPATEAAAPLGAHEPSPSGDLAALRAQARAAQAKLADQPLQITNSNSLLIMKLFGG